MCMLLVWAWMGVGVYCSWEMLSLPSTVTCTKTFLGKGPCLPQGSWWCVLRVRSSCLSTQGSRLVYQLENLWVQLASQSFLVGLAPVVLLCQVTLQPSFLVFSSPSCPRVGSCFPTPFTFLHLAPLSPHFFFCPFTPSRLSS